MSEQKHEKKQPKTELSLHDSFADHCTENKCANKSSCSLSFSCRSNAESSVVIRVKPAGGKGKTIIWATPQFIFHCDFIGGRGRNSMDGNDGNDEHGEKKTS